MVGAFRDPSATPVLQQVLKSAPEAADRLDSAIGLWLLGDETGIPVVVKYVKAEEQPYGSWDTPIWFLMKSHTKAGLDALHAIVIDGPAPRAGEVMNYIATSITGDLWGSQREPAGSLEICPLLVAAMGRADEAGGTINGIKIRVKDTAAKAFIVLRDGTKDRFGGRFFQVDPKVFNELDPDAAERDKQIEALRQWYEKNKDHLAWNSQANKLDLKKQ